MITIASWSKYYGSVPIETTNKNSEFISTNKTLFKISGNTYVYDCFFHDMSSETGGAILYSISHGNLLIEKCSFYFCNSTGYTAAIRVIKGNLVVAFTCGYGCYSNSCDGFSSITSDSEDREFIKFFDTTVSHCEAKENIIMNNAQGTVYIKSLNLSNNKVSQNSIACSPSKIDSKTKIGCFLAHSSFRNNTATQVCIYFDSIYHINSIFQIKCSNVIDNKANQTITTNSETNIFQSSIINNIDPFFYQTNPESKITLTDCNTDISQIESSQSITQIEITSPFIVALTFIGTGKCNNLFALFVSTKKCQTAMKNIFIHNAFLNYLFVFICESL